MYDMRITLSLDDRLVRKAREIARERSTTVTGLVREYLQGLAAEDAALGRKRREADVLEQSFRQLQIRVGKRTWRRDDLHNRSQAGQ
jgi:hypothetical protein